MIKGMSCGVTEESSLMVLTGLANLAYIFMAATSSDQIVRTTLPAGGGAPHPGCVVAGHWCGGLQIANTRFRYSRQIVVSYCFS